MSLSFTVVCPIHFSLALDMSINHSMFLGKGLLKLLEESKHTDITFLIGGHPIAAHRMIVASQSEYFDCLLYGSMKEARETEIVLEDTTVEAFQALLKYMYSGAVSVLEVQVIEMHHSLNLTLYTQ